MNLKVKNGPFVFKQRGETELRERRGEICQLSFQGSIQLIVVELFETRTFSTGRRMA
jgi:hypothetical protein